MSLQTGERNHGTELYFSSVKDGVVYPKLNEIIGKGQ